MKRTFVILAGAILAIWLIGTATADNGIHGDYSATTDKCAACHRAHTATGDSLLNVSASATDKSAFCYSCHSGGQGAYTDVRDGLFISTTASVPITYESTTLPATNNRPLRGGGFESVKMNVGLTSSLTISATSQHMVSGGTNTVWGYGPITSTSYVGPSGVSLTCTSCHSPHGKAGAGNTTTYRLLKGNNNAKNTPLFTTGTLTVTASVDVADESGNKVYYVNSITDTYYAESYSSINKANMSSWCAQCHTRYSAANSADSTDAIFKFRHMSNGTNGPTAGCFACHVAHGTGARMGSYSGAVNWPGGASSPSGNSRSSLLRLDNRGVCEQCHGK